MANRSQHARLLNNGATLLDLVPAVLRLVISPVHVLKDGGAQELQIHWGRKIIHNGIAESVNANLANTPGFFWRIYSANPSLEWPICKEDRALEGQASRTKDLSRYEFRRQTTRKLHRYARIAHILLHMEADFCTYGEKDALSNWTENEFHKLALQNHLGVTIRVEGLAAAIMTAANKQK